MSEQLDEADELDLQSNILSIAAQKLRHEYLESKGWEVTGEMIGPSMTYIYKKGDYIGICEFDALDHEEFDCTEGG